MWVVCGRPLVLSEVVSDLGGLDLLLDLKLPPDIILLSETYLKPLLIRCFFLVWVPQRGTLLCLMTKPATLEVEAD